MIRGRKYVICLVTVLVLLGFFNLGLVSAEDTVSYTDPTGDVENDGVSQEGEQSADITSISMDYSGDPVVIEMSVAGNIVYQGSGMIYDYYVYIDHDDDGEEETTIEVSNLYGNLFSSDMGDDHQMTTRISGNGTSTLRIEIPLEWYTTTPSFTDVAGDASVTSSNFMYNADDEINEDFQGASGGGGGGGGQPPDLYLPPEEDPADATPTDPSISINIDDYDMKFTMGSDQYELVQEASGTGDASIYKCAYTVVTYYKSGDPTFSAWEQGPTESSHSYGEHSFEETFGGTSAPDNWEDWEWYFKSTGPSDSTEINEYREGSGYWDEVDRAVLYVRAFNDEGDWNQDSMDVTDEMIEGSSSGNGGSGDDDTSDDDTGDDDTGDDDGEDDDGDDSPAPGLLVVIGGVVTVLVLATMFGRRRK